MGFAGNTDPQFVIPSVIGLPNKNVKQTSRYGIASKRGVEDLDFYIGDEAFANGQMYGVSYPMRQGQIENWDHMERIWETSIFKYMRCEPENHYFVLTEPPLNAPENREQMAEIFFESFNVNGLYIAVQAVLALVASWTSKNSNQSLTGLVVDSGDGVTHIIPVAEGYVLGGSLKSMPIAGRDITSFVMQQLRDRNEPIPPEQMMETAKTIKEQYGYTCHDIVKEFEKYDLEPSKNIIRHMLKDNRGTIDVGYERFLGPEVFFNPEIISTDYLTPLPTLIDQAIQSAPIDTRRGLYSNIVLSGGSTMFSNLGKRLQRDLRKIVDDRQSSNQAQLMAARLKNPLQQQTGGGDSGAFTITANPVAVNVISHKKQRHAVWFGGSILGSTDQQFYQVAHSKADYEEYGPSICRYNKVFTSLG
ncbi:Actin-related protein 3 [Zancudomyces culisetae]|uniref:Actin-related protein 3 n=1 Tax=Zancudomyces culisetae TaxID=1213189 RepID=A0A1R1PGF3_ZANCU|nr:Actin-related protein 3 [Zancudomyces culisetae]OMH80263.1 Actin-related protein 3 [Zancudomyces culisetae]|eukprot:OMH80060.1 Actin-related protein 3 [Zancudomyces culisetae]